MRTFYCDSLYQWKQQLSSYILYPITELETNLRQICTVVLAAFSAVNQPIDFCMLVHFLEIKFKINW